MVDFVAVGLIAAAGQTVGLVLVTFVAVGLFAAAEEEEECQLDSQDLWKNVVSSCECLVHVYHHIQYHILMEYNFFYAQKHNRISCTICHFCRVSFI